MPEGPSATLILTAPPEMLLALTGFLYVIFTVTCSAVYIYHLDPTFRNDHWWPGFNTSATQTFISDVFNAKLIAGEAGDFSLLGVLREKDYSGITTFIDMRRSAARRLLLLPLPPETAIQVLRRNTFQTNLHIITPYCWVDFHRQWELAHTAKRQERCLNHDLQNAAVYVEALLRNSVNWIASQFYLPMRTTIFSDINSTADGMAWLSRLHSFTMVSVEDEVAEWSRQNLTAWTSQLQNLFQEGFDDSIELVNALGVCQRITITSIADVRHGSSAWTTAWAYAGFWNDLIACQVFNCSVVRGSPTHIDQIGLDWDKDIYNGRAETRGSRLIRTKLGPYEAIDLRFVQLPTSLLLLYTEFDKLYNNAQTQQDIPVTSTLDAVPIAWQSGEFVFYGGNPLCPFGFPQTFVQHSFGYYDDCGTQDPHTIDLTRRSASFATSMSSLKLRDVRATCRACLSTVELCTKVLIQAVNQSDTIFWPNPEIVVQVTQEVKDLHLSMLQTAPNTTNNIDMMLIQEMIADGDPWSFFGWVTVWEWMDGQREVFVFESDENAVTIMSRPHGFLPLPANSLELPQVACNYIRIFMMYVTGVLLGLGVVLMAFGARSCFEIDGSNLFIFNRVVGSVWLVRPLLFLRGMTAILV
ncbi:unnamed protein product [Aphanomyces euteiches]